MVVTSHMWIKDLFAIVCLYITLNIAGIYCKIYLYVIAQTIW